MPKKNVSTKNATGGREFKIELLNSAQKMAWAAFQKHDVLFLLGPAGTGKTFLATAFAIKSLLAKETEKIILTRPIVESGESLGYLPGPQPLDAKILTPFGWKTMGEIKIGDEVIGRDGLPAKVLKIFPKGKKQVYKLTTDDGSTTECCGDHLWFTQTKEDKKRGKAGSIKTTAQISETLLNKGKYNHFLPRNEAVCFEEKDLPLSPYTLGVLLGDGCLSNSISFASKDQEIIDRVETELNLIGCKIGSMSGISCHISNQGDTTKPARKLKVSNIKDGSFFEFDSIRLASQELSVNLGTLKARCKNQSVISNCKFEFVELENRWSNPIKNIIESLGLLNKKAPEKFVPNMYKTASISQRLDLLRGLMDTDGCCKKNGEASFTTTSSKLAHDVIELVKSLGGRAVLRKRNRVGKKSTLGSRTIVNKLEAFEFTVSLPNCFNPFFLTRKRNNFACKYITDSRIVSIELVSKKEVQCIALDNPEHLYITDDYIVTHNTFEEKVNPYMMPIYDCIDKLVGVEGMLKDKIVQRTEVAPLAYLRGRTFNNAVCLFDEAQNATMSQLKLFMTRFGEGSKIIITGDPRQSDIGCRSGLVEVVSRLREVPGIGVVEFKNNSIVRHPLIGAILDKLEDGKEE